MRNAILLMLGSTLVACGPTGAATSSAPAEPASPPAEAFTAAEKTELVDFSYRYPAAAAAIPALARQLQADMARIKAEALGFATQDRDSARDSDRPFHGHYLHKEWTSLGETSQLLSLTALVETFTGGAHGNSGLAALLWDRAGSREVPLASLFPSALSLEHATRAAYCKELDAERAKRREGEALEGQFSECPKYAELVVAPADEDGDRRFDHLRFLAGPYVAGPYVEGAYEISIAVPPELIAAVQPRYRDSFEAQPQ